MDISRLLPYPRSILFKEKGVFDLRSNAAIGFNDASLSRMASELAEEFASKGIMLKVDNGSRGIFLEIARNEFLDGKSDEAYELDITPEGIVIRALHERGIFYGTRTLLQMTDADAVYESVEIRDCPEFSVRGVHWMLQGPIPNHEWFIKAVKELADCKINTILLEYEDKFPYQNFPVLNHGLAFSGSELSALIAAAERYHIQVIPLLQCLGHVEYILKHEEYAHLRERPHDPFQYCASDDGTFKMFEGMAREILPFHKNSKYFHVGADETYFLGTCDKCRAKAPDVPGKARIYVEHLNKVCDFVIANGKIPILWSDMFVDFPEYLKMLNHKAVVMYWEYTPQTAQVPWVKWKGRAFIGDDIVEEIPENIRKIYAPYWGGTPFPKQMNAFPYTKFFRDAGRDVIAAPIADQVQTYENISEFSLNAKEFGSLGLVTTSWPLFPAANAWFGFLATADRSWNAGTGIPAFEERFERLYFGKAGSGAAGLPRLLNKRTRSADVAMMQAGEAEKVFRNLEEQGGNWLYKGSRAIASQRRYEAERMRVLPKAKEMAAAISISEWGDFIEDARFPESPEKLRDFTIEKLSDVIGGLKSLKTHLLNLEEDIKEDIGSYATASAIEEYFSAAYGSDREFIGKWLPPLKLLLTARKLENVIRY